MHIMTAGEQPQGNNGELNGLIGVLDELDGVYWYPHKVGDDDHSASCGMTIALDEGVLGTLTLEQVLAGLPIRR